MTAKYDPTAMVTRMPRMATTVMSSTRVYPSSFSTRDRESMPRPSPCPCPASAKYNGRATSSLVGSRRRRTILLFSAAKAAAMSLPDPEPPRRTDTHVTSIRRLIAAHERPRVRARARRDHSRDRRRPRRRLRRRREGRRAPRPCARCPRTSTSRRACWRPSTAGSCGRATPRPGAPWRRRRRS